MAQQPQIQFQTSPPIDLPLWHRFLRTADLLWLSREAGEAIIVLAESLATPEPRIATPDEILAMAIRDLHECYIDLEFLDHDEAPHWGELGVVAFKVRPVLGEIVERLKGVVEVDLSGDDTLNPVRALYGLWAGPQVVAALGIVGHRVAVDQHETTDLPSMVDDPLWCLAAGLICDLPFIAVVLRQIGEASAELREMVNQVAEQLEAESRRLLSPLTALPVSE